MEPIVGASASKPLRFSVGHCRRVDFRSCLPGTTIARPSPNSPQELLHAMMDFPRHVAILAENGALRSYDHLIVRLMTQYEAQNQ